MHLERDSDGLTIRLTSPDEMRRLHVALLEACATVSRAEFFIRTGLSAPEVEALADVVLRAAKGERLDSDVSLNAGVETVENPRRPRPSPSGPTVEDDAPSSS